MRRRERGLVSGRERRLVRQEIMQDFVRIEKGQAAGNQPDQKTTGQAK